MEVTEFMYLDDLHLVRYKVGSGKLFVVEKPYQVSFKLDGKYEVVTVPAGMATDLASIPSIVPKWIAQKVDKHIEAAVVHDYLCNIKGPWSSKVAADIFLAGMKAANVGAITRNIMYQAVVMFGPQWEMPEQG